MVWVVLSKSPNGVVKVCGVYADSTLADIAIFKMEQWYHGYKFWREMWEVKDCYV